MKTIPITPVYEAENRQSESVLSEPAFDGSRSLDDAPSTCASSALVALQVLDASMAPELNTGQIVVIDRTGKLNEDSLVLVETHPQFLIRRWRPIDNNNVELMPLNPLWKTQRFANDKVQLKGVVTQRMGHRRRERKRYA